jgi:hypothetical protein
VKPRRVEPLLPPLDPVKVSSADVMSSKSALPSWYSRWEVVVVGKVKLVTLPLILALLILLLVVFVVSFIGGVLVLVEMRTGGVPGQLS